MELTIDIIDKLMTLMKKHGVDKLKLDGLELNLPKPAISKEKTNNPALPQVDDELLYWSATSSPSLTAEEISAFSVNGIPVADKPKRGRKPKDVE